MDVVANVLIRDHTAMSPSAPISVGCGPSKRPSGVVHGVLQARLASPYRALTLCGILNR